MSLRLLLWGVMSVRSTEASGNVIATGRSLFSLGVLSPLGEPVPDMRFAPLMPLLGSRGKALVMVILCNGPLLP